MSVGKYKDFSKRLIDAMKSNGHESSRSPSGISIQTLAQFVGVSEQITRRYIRGEALPDYDKIKEIASCLKVSPGWLLFGDQQPDSKKIDDDLLHYILKTSHHLYKKETKNTDDYADFVIGLMRDVRDIDTSKENLLKIINLAVSSISSYKEKRSQHVG